MKKSMWEFSITILCFMFASLIFTSCRKDGEEKRLTICTEESLLYDVEEVVRYFKDSQETPVDIQISYIPSKQEDRASICKKWRTELMAGKGADLYIMKDYGISRNISVSEEEILLADPNKLLTSGVFLDLSEYIGEDEDFQSCFAPVMEAGAVNGRQYIVPFTFNVTLLRSPDGKGSLTYRDCTDPLTDLLESGKLGALSAADLLFYVKDRIGSSFDYQKGKVMFSPEDVSQVLEYAVDEAQKGIKEGSYEVVSIQNDRYPYASLDLEMERPEYQYLPFPTLDGRVSATVLSYGAIGRTCKNPELAYEFLKIFWSEGFASGEGLTIPDQQYSRHYLIDTVFNIDGLTVRQDQWQNWYKNKPENINASEMVLKNEENMLSIVRQVSTARFVCTIDYLGMDIRDMFWENGILNVDKEAIQQDIQTASNMLYNSTRYIVME